MPLLRKFYTTGLIDKIIISLYNVNVVNESVQITQAYSLLSTYLTTAKWRGSMVPD